MTGDELEEVNHVIRHLTSRLVLHIRGCGHSRDQKCRERYTHCRMALAEAEESIKRIGGKENGD